MKVGMDIEFCHCYKCTDFKFERDWRESEGKLMWRYDGRCGGSYTLPDGTPAQCDPDGGKHCCNDSNVGYCGSTYYHCSCDRCTDYKFEREWREAGGDIMWRPDGLCGSDEPLPDGTPAQCDPDGENPCCNGWTGQCGNTTEECYCDFYDCVDYRIVYKEWRESGGKKKWRYDGKCGKDSPLPDGSPAQCDPDGKNPCCEDIEEAWNGASCGNTTSQCTCNRCVDYRIVYKDWTESGGKQKWRYDGKCGRANPLPDGTPAECDPDGDYPCCENLEGGNCGRTISMCLCEGCVDYGIVSAVRASGVNCTTAKIFSGFLKHVCFDEETKKLSFRCVYSDVNYDVSPGAWVSERCENDPKVYQACGFGAKIADHGELLCMSYICENPETHLEGKHIECEGDDCRADMRANCTKSPVAVHQLCDGKCDESDCVDESYCNGYRYGVNCTNKHDGRQIYLHAAKLCLRTPHCEEGLDQQDCSITNTTAHTCAHTISGIFYARHIVPILNHTRCSVFDFTKTWSFTLPYCMDYLDQTNCSDIRRVGGYCPVGGFLTSVSKTVVCNDFDTFFQRPIKICDDDLQNECVTDLPNNCIVHKHRMCDGVKDCSDGSDEVHDMCDTKRTRAINFDCSRNFNLEYGNNAFPTSWIMDGTVDCMDGEDEDPSRWKFCGGKYKQMLLPGQDCQNAYRCPGGNESYVSFDQLCDGIESCGDGGENQVCRIARDFPDIEKSASYTDAIRDLCDENVSTCDIKEFSGLWGESEVFGMTTENRFLVPTSKVDCSGLFGEFYLFLSCMNLCSEEDVTCPLDEMTGVLKHDSCPGQFPDRAYTIVDNSFLVFLDRSDRGNYHQEFYQCKNSRCVEYKQVCDLVDDCGDMSDEIICKNHMICEDTLNSTKHQFIALSQRCDGIYDCFDLSDECNDECGKQIVENWALKIICWFMGTLALLFNFYSMVQGFSTIKDCETENMLTSKVLMSLISSGDFLIGLYLVIISVYDSIVMREDFCRQQAEWLTGTTCLSLGVISTFGSQISLFTMTVLSVIRMYGLIFKAMRVPGPVNKKAIVRVSSVAIATITAALTIAVVPLIPYFEDYFVQGMYYDPSYKVFVGFPNKERHIKILQEYSEKTNTGNSTLTTAALSWKDIANRVDEMFTQDYGTLTRTPVHFYGNDGLCLFKYFVRNNDARRSRQSGDDMGSYKRDPVVWTILAVNFFCFVIITCCYIMINIQTIGLS